jgi:hypothetical protein
METLCINMNGSHFVAGTLPHPRLCVQNRWEGLLKRGRTVIAVGDFNISPFPVDFCNPGPDFDQSSYVFILDLDYFMLLP